MALQYRLLCGISGWDTLSYHLSLSPPSYSQLISRLSSNPQSPLWPSEFAYQLLGTLKDLKFLHGFTHDYWLGKYQLNSGNDKFLTRWMVSHG